ncbi:MAG: DUF6240 domain-containing protein [Muribaculum sp.]|nr:DUF6240 domain-containing protein [Muribaculum sp.]
MNITIQNPNHRADASSAARTEHGEAGRPPRAEHRNKTHRPETEHVAFSVGEEGFHVFDGIGEGNEGREQGKTLTDLQREASAADVGISQDYMTVVSHTMSEEDYQRMSEEGFHFASLNPKEAVTIVDKIKAELVRSGKYIAGYTDDLDMDTLAAAVGSDTLARALSKSFREADLPLTQENIAAVERAWNMASQLAPPTENTYRYMAGNAMEPEIWNFYLAQNSGADAPGRDRTVPREELDYLADEKMRKQIDKVLEQAGYEPNEENREAAEWLLERRLPLTPESVSRLKRLREAQVPVTEERFAQAAAEAVAAGRDPIHADLSGTSERGGNLYRKAAEVLRFYRARYDALERPDDFNYEELEKWMREQGDLGARKQLEEIRLCMTAEVNVKLLKSGFAIDTAPMEELITALREAEAAVAGSYFPEDAQAVAKYENWNRTNDVMRDLPELPARLLGTVRIEAADGQDASVLEDFHAEGAALRRAYERAGESYETLMTAPRADLGDSIEKAFGNAEELLRELGIEPTEENLRTVRILGYNHMEISEENLDRVKEADRQVHTVIDKMTPAATLQMIRDGVNPLELSFAELNKYFDNLPSGFQEQAVSYSRYLYGLEQNKQITRQERETYIGVYRLLNQIERKDGAAVGAVVNTQAELQFANLLSAVRSGKFGHMDVRATDELGVLRELAQRGESRSISEQISAGYVRQELEELRQVSQVDQAASAMLERGELPASAENLLAAQELLRDPRGPFKAFRQQGQEREPVRELWEQLSDKEAFQEEYEETIARMQSETEDFTLNQAQSSLDVRAFRMAHRQLSIMGSLSHSEEYILEMQVGEETAAVHLRLEQGSGRKGAVSIAVDYGESAHIEANLQVKNGRVEGFLLGKTSQEVTKLQETSDIFYNLINENTSLQLEAVKLPVVSRGNINMTGTSENGSQGETPSPDNGTLYRVAKLFLQAIR